MSYLCLLLSLYQQYLIPVFWIKTFHMNKNVLWREHTISEAAFDVVLVWIYWVKTKSVKSCFSITQRKIKIEVSRKKWLKQKQTKNVSLSIDCTYFTTGYNLAIFLSNFRERYLSNYPSCVIADSRKTRPVDKRNIFHSLFTK